MNKMAQYVLGNLAFGRGAYADLIGGEAYSEATKACTELIAKGHISRDLKR